MELLHRTPQEQKKKITLSRLPVTFSTTMGTLPSDGRRLENDATLNKRLTDTDALGMHQIFTSYQLQFW